MLRRVASTFIALGASAALFASPAAAQTQVVLANPALSLSFSAGYLAEDLGYFKQNGLEVKTILIPGVAAFNAVVSGSADFAQPSAISLTRAAAKGQRMLAIAETSNRPIIQVALRKDVANAGGFDPQASFEKRAALLRGRTVAVDATGSLIHGYVLLMAKRAGIDANGMQIAFMQPPAMLAAFQAKQIDGFAMSPPWPEVPVAQDDAVMLASGPDGEPADLEPFANNVVVTQPATCQKRRAVCEGMVHALVAAEAYIHDHPAEALALLKKRFSTLDDKVLSLAFDTIRKISPNPPLINPKGLDNAERFNIDAGLMKPEDKLASYEGLYTNDFVK